MVPRLTAHQYLIASEENALAADTRFNVQALISLIVVITLECFEPFDDPSVFAGGVRLNYQDLNCAGRAAGQQHCRITRNDFSKRLHGGPAPVLTLPGSSSIIQRQVVPVKYHNKYVRPNKFSYVPRFTAWRNAARHRNGRDSGAGAVLRRPGSTSAVHEPVWPRSLPARQAAQRPQLWPWSNQTLVLE